MKFYLMTWKDEHPLWYAGLGAPYKTTRTITEAKWLKKDDPHLDKILLGLKKFLGLDFLKVSVDEVTPNNDYVCAECGVTWDEREITLKEIPLGSRLFMDKKTEMTHHSTITKARYCGQCKGLICGLHPAFPQRGATKGMCNSCKDEYNKNRYRRR